jgi:hypothetical protein
MDFLAWISGLQKNVESIEKKEEEPETWNPWSHVVHYSSV